MRAVSRRRMLTSASGQALVLVAAGLVGFIMLVALAIDGGYGFWVKRSLQSSADAAALAGAQELPSAANAQTRALEYSGNKSPQGRNYAAPLDTVTTVVTDCVGSGGCPNRVIVEERASVPTFFAKLVGIDSYEVTARAVAGRTIAAGPSLAIYAHEPCGNKGFIANGQNYFIDGGIHSNGNFSINGTNFNSGAATIHRPQSGCTTVYPPPSGVDFDGADTPTSTGFRDWLTPYKATDFPCNYTHSGGKTWNTFGQVIPTGVHCSTGTLKVDGNSISGTITFVAPKIEINGNDLNFTAHTSNVLFFGTGPNEIVLNAANYTWTGYVINRLGNIKVNGAPAVAFLGLLEGKSVEINLNEFSMVGTYVDSSGVTSLALIE